MAFSAREQEVVDDSGDGRAYNSFDTSDLYIPMKIFSLENFLEIAEKIKTTSYGVVQEDPIFQKSISEEELVTNVFNTDHKMVLLAEAGNGKTLFARRILKIQQEKYPDTFTFFIHLKAFANKKECSLAEILLPAEFHGTSPGSQEKRANALKLISDSPDECLFIIDSIEDFDERRKIIEALVTGNVCGDESNTVALSGGNLEYETVLPTWQWINELLIGKQFNKQKKTRAIVLARPETVAYYNVQNPVVNNKRPGLCWGKLHQEYFADSSFTILSIFGLAVSNLKSDFPDAALEHRNPDIHRAFLNLLDHDSGFAFFCRKPFQMFLFYDTFCDVAGN